MFGWRKAPVVLVLAVALGQSSSARVSQEDSFLTAFYDEPTAVTCRTYRTANGARSATYQWWILGFVSGSFSRSRIKQRPAKMDVPQILERAASHCLSRPGDTLADAAAAIVRQLE